MFRNRQNRPRRSLPPVAPENAAEILLASEGRPFTEDALKLAARMSLEGRGRAMVITIARLHGTSFGLPNPGLQPNRREMAEQEEIVESAIAKLKKLGVPADGHIAITRSPRKSILKEARRCHCSAIVMGADPKRNPFVSSLMWSQEPYRVRRRSDIPVHLVETSP
ncbi:universal stress protein [Mycolicibacterium brisbanense]|uniref:Universal stress protein n=1 Tax=Mycolicibacterium brisbanense TaxID=146020 RepID=A0A100W0D0_9MYCO|nr:universal stress protein [Mycolicibacterium brisbanense]